MDLLAQIATTVVGFFLLVLVLRRFFWRSVLALLDERRSRIEQGLRDVEQAKRQAEQAQAEYARRLAAGYAQQAYAELDALRASPWREQLRALTALAVDRGS